MNIVVHFCTFPNVKHSPTFDQRGALVPCTWEGPPWVDWQPKNIIINNYKCNNVFDMDDDNNILTIQCYVERGGEGGWFDFFLT